jgi:sugar phosphate isomerase/epimerase
MFNRRKFLIASGSAVALSAADSLAADAAPQKNSICVFTKPFQSLSYDELADRVAELGFDGIEATIRDGGHIEPQQVADELPKMVEALRSRNLEITVMTSSINDPQDRLTEPVLRTAAGLGIKRYRMKYFNYDSQQPIAKQIAGWRSQFQELAALNAEVGIRALYQNHASGKMLGAALWDLARVLRGIPTEQIAVAYDIRHATVEGGMSWPTTFRMIRPHVDTVYVKDFVWSEGSKPSNVPLGQGRVDPKFFGMLAETGFAGPISLHEEYLDHRPPELVPEHLAAIKKDFATLQQWMRG